MAQIKQVGIGRRSTGTIDGITYYVRGGIGGTVLSTHFLNLQFVVYSLYHSITNTGQATELSQRNAILNSFD